MLIVFITVSGMKLLRGMAFYQSPGHPPFGYLFEFGFYAVAASLVTFGLYAYVWEAHVRPRVQNRQITGIWASTVTLICFTVLFHLILYPLLDKYKLSFFYIHLLAFVVGPFVAGNRTASNKGDAGEVREGDWPWKNQNDQASSPSLPPLLANLQSTGPGLQRYDGEGDDKAEQACLTSPTSGVAPTPAPQAVESRQRLELENSPGNGIGFLRVLMHSVVPFFSFVLAALVIMGLVFIISIPTLPSVSKGFSEFIGGIFILGFFGILFGGPFLLISFALPSLLYGVAMEALVKRGRTVSFVSSFFTSGFFMCVGWLLLCASFNDKKMGTLEADFPTDYWFTVSFIGLGCLLSALISGLFQRRLWSQPKTR